MSEEIWKPIKGTDGKYEVCNLGYVRTNGKRPGLLTLTKQPKGYLYAMIEFPDGKKKNCRVHRLVAEYFLPNPDNLPCINHIDGDKTNNIVSNLEWCTYQQNMQHAVRIGLTHPHQWTDEERKQISERNKGQVVSNKQRQKISEALKGRPRPDVSARQKGKAPSRKAIEASIATRKRKAEERSAERAMQPKKPRAKGWHWSNEAKQRLREQRMKRGLK